MRKNARIDGIDENRMICLPDVRCCRAIFHDIRSNDQINRVVELVISFQSSIIAQNFI